MKQGRKLMSLALALVCLLGMNCPLVLAEDLLTFRGTIQSKDLESRTIIVSGVGADIRTFEVPVDANILVHEINPRGKLWQLLDGDRVEVTYTDDDGVYTAQSVAVKRGFFRESE